MIVGTGPVGIICAFMIIPVADPWRGSMRALQVAVTLILRVPGPVVAERDDFVCRFMRAPQSTATLGAITGIIIGP